MGIFAAGAVVRSQSIGEIGGRGEGRGRGNGGTGGRAWGLVRRGEDRGWEMELVGHFSPKQRQWEMQEDLIWFHVVLTRVAERLLSQDHRVRGLGGRQAANASHHALLLGHSWII